MAAIPCAGQKFVHRFLLEREAAQLNEDLIHDLFIPERESTQGLFKLILFDLIGVQLLPIRGDLIFAHVPVSTPGQIRLLRASGNEMFLNLALVQLNTVLAAEIIDDS